MIKTAKLREPMDMPDPSFPVKIGICRASEPGQTLFSHHWHEHIEFLYMLSGTMVVECGTVPLQMHPGEMAVINSNELHYGVSTSSDLRYYVMIMDISLLQSQSSDPVDTKFITPIAQNRLLFHNKIVGDDTVSECMHSLADELQNKALGYELATKSHLYRLLSLLVRKYVAASVNWDVYRLRLRNLERLAPVFRHIEQHSEDALPVQQLADLAGLSRYHFSRLFKQLTDKTPVEYINLTRINKSESLLRQTKMNISEVALAAGFNDIYYFSRTFKRLKKISPSAWRTNDTMTERGAAK